MAKVTITIPYEQAEILVDYLDNILGGYTDFKDDLEKALHTLEVRLRKAL